MTIHPMTIDERIRAAVDRGADLAPATPDFLPAIHRGARRRRTQRRVAGAAGVLGAAGLAVALTFGSSPAPAPEVPQPAATSDPAPPAQDIPPDQRRASELPPGPVPSVPVPYLIDRSGAGRPDELHRPDGTTATLTAERPHGAEPHTDDRGTLLLVGAADDADAGGPIDGQLVEMAPGSDGQRVIAEGYLEHVAVSPDGGQVAVGRAHEKNGRVRTVDILDRGSGQVLRSVEVGDCELKGWTTSGVVAWRPPAGAPLRPLGDLVVIDPRSGEHREVPLPDRLRGGAPRVVVANRLDLAVASSDDTSLAETVDLAPGGTRGTARGIPGGAPTLTPDGTHLVTTAAVVETETLRVVARLAGSPASGRAVVWDSGILAPGDAGVGPWFTCSWSGATECHRLDGFPPQGK